MITAIIRNKENTLVLELPHSCLLYTSDAADD